MCVFLSGARSVQCSYHKWSHRNMQSSTLLFRQVQNNRLKNSEFQGRSIYKFRDEKGLFLQTNVYNPSSSSFEMYQLSGSEEIYTPKTTSARRHVKELKVRVTSTRKEAGIRESGSLNQQPSLPCIPGFQQLFLGFLSLATFCLPYPFQPHLSPTKVALLLWFSSSDEYSQLFIGKKFTLQVSNTHVLVITK